VIEREQNANRTDQIERIKTAYFQSSAKMAQKSFFTSTEVTRQKKSRKFLDTFTQTIQTKRLKKIRNPLIEHSFCAVLAPVLILSI